MTSLSDYANKHKERFLDELIEFLKIPSVSAKPDHAQDMLRTAEWIRDNLLKIGVTHVEIVETANHPIVYGEMIIDPKLPTIVVYGHYDVQPAEPMDEWTSPPFEPVIKDNRIYARGACDDKGQLFMHLKAFECMHHTGNLTCNVKFMIEGEEEIGSENLEHFCIENVEKLSGDVILISDTSIISNDVPSITAGLRGICYMQVEITGPNRDLHSGTYGGAVANPINVLCALIADMKDDRNRIMIPGFYDDVEEASTAERTLLNRAPFSLELYKRDLEIDKVEGEEGYTTLERTSIRPTLDVNGIWGGYTGKGSKTVLPSKAYAKISMRLVPNQKPDKIAKLFEDYFVEQAPESVKVRVSFHHGGLPVITPLGSIEYKAAEAAMSASFGQTPIPQRSGGSIPIVALFKEVLEMDSILLGFGLDTDNIHSPNESFGLFNFYKGIETIPHFYKQYAELKKNDQV